MRFVQKKMILALLVTIDLAYVIVTYFFLNGFIGKKRNCNICWEGPYTYRYIVFLLFGRLEKNKMGPKKIKGGGSRKKWLG